MSGRETEKKVLEFMRENHMTEKGGGVLTGVSGGADSVCLLLILSRLRETLGIRLHGFHMNHGLRGSEADRDERFSGELCRKLGIPFTAVHEDVRAFAETFGMSEEEAGRELRYRRLKETADRLGLSRIAVAHHMDDSAETVLFHLFRGSGFRGLSGICPVRDAVIRPLLCLRRREIEEYLRGEGQSWCEDSTNRLSDYSRNRIRNELLPWAEENLNSRASEHLLGTARLAAYADQYFEALAAAILSEERKRGFPADSVGTEVFDRQPYLVQTYLVRELIFQVLGKRKDISSRHLSAVLSLKGPGGGTETDLPGGILARRGYDRLQILKKEADAGNGRPASDAEFCAVELPKEAEVCRLSVPGGGWTAVFRKLSREKDAEFPKNQYTKWFDYDKIKGTLCVRPRREGDYFLISGGKKKSLRRYLIDQKIPEEERGGLFLLAEGSHILWVIGHRISEYYKISDTTEYILEIKLCKGEEHG